MPRRVDVDKDTQAVVTLVNSAYDIVTGSEGIAYKKMRRFEGYPPEALLEVMKESWVIEEEGRIVGVVRFA